MCIPLIVNYFIAAFLCGNSQEIDRLYNLYFDSSWMTFSNYHIYVPFITSICGIYFWLQVSRIVATVINEKDIIYKIGNNTFNIMTHHIFCFFVFNSIIFYLSKIFMIDYLNFNYEFYYTNVWYKVTNFWPFIELIYVIIGVFGSILLGFLANKIKIFIKTKFC